MKSPAANRRPRTRRDVNCRRLIAVKSRSCESSRCELSGVNCRTVNCREVNGRDTCTCSVLESKKSKFVRRDDVI